MHALARSPRRSVSVVRPHSEGGQLLAVLGLCLAAACGKGSDASEPDDEGGSGQTGNDGGASGAKGDVTAGSGGATAGAGGDAEDLSDPGGCVMSEAWIDSIDTPNPRIPVALPVVVSHPEDVTNPEVLVDGAYRTTSGSTITGATADDPRWVAIDLGDVSADRLLLVWNDRGTSTYDTTGKAPGAYRIEVSADSTNGENGSWELALDAEGNPIEVVDNPVRARGHSFGFTGRRWVRFVVTSPQSKADGTLASSVSLDEISIYDVSESGNSRPQDTWFMMGDSITQMALSRDQDVGAESYFESVVNASTPNYSPAVISGGIGGEFASDGLEHLELWLELNPDFSHVGISYGTNDSWSQGDAAAQNFEENLREIVQAVLDAGRIPHLSRIPFATDDNHSALPAFNDVIDALVQEFDLPCGPDHYTAFYDSDAEKTLGTDGVHPTTAGKRLFNATWAESVLPMYLDE